MLTITKFPAEAVDDHVNVHSRRGYQRNLRDADRAAVPCQLYMLPPACIFMGLLPVPWVVSAAGEGGALASEAERGQGDEGLGAVESVCHTGDEPYLGID